MTGVFTASALHLPRAGHNRNAETVAGRRLVVAGKSWTCQSVSCRAILSPAYDCLTSHFFPFIWAIWVLPYALPISFCLLRHESKNENHDLVLESTI